MMKNLLLTVVAFVALTTSMLAQEILDYNFSTELQGYYTPLTNDAVLITGAFDDAVSSPISIPGFPMGGQQYYTMFVSTNGFISLGMSANNTEYNPLSSNQTMPIISPFGRDLQNVDATSRISYAIDNDGVHVQWENVRRYGVAGESFSFQAHLLQADSSITFVYGSFNNISGNPSTAQIGLRVGQGAFPQQCANRMVANGGYWFPSTAGTSNSSNCAISAITQPFNGLTYVWGHYVIGAGGCTDATACNYTADAVYNDGSCEYCSCQLCGCMDSTACNFDVNAVYNSVCTYYCYGCTDPTATNFDPNATYSNGSCFYAAPGESCGEPIILECGLTYTGNTVGISNDNAVSGASSCLSTIGTAGQQWYAFMANAVQTVTASTVSSFTNFDTQLHVFSANSFSACGALNCLASNDDSNGTLQSQVTFTTQPGVIYYIRVGGYLSNSGDYEFTTTGLCSLGCTNATACNYDATAIADDGSCEYCSCGGTCGCTNPNACNYNAQATIDDGSCMNSLFVSASADTMVCLGQSVQLWGFSTANAASYMWMGMGMVISTTPVATFTPTGNGVYELIVTDANGCTGSDVVMINVFQCVSGCMDLAACNFDPNANYSTGCDYSCFGCTNADAMNYDATASIDNGSCYFEGEGTMCTNPISVSCAEGFYSAMTVGVANDNATSGAMACGGASSGGQRWYVYYAQFSSAVTVSTINSLTNFDTYLKVFAGSCGNLMCIGQNDDIPGTNFQSQLTFNAVAGNTYFIRVGGFSSQQGTFGLTFDCGGGCLDPLACNYNAQAPFEDGSCTYGADCYGCTDIDANNFAPQAVYNQGCQYTTSVTVYHDNNGDGIRQAGEPGLSNWAVYVPAISATVFTNNLGVATLSVSSNTYSIELVNNTTDWTSSSPSTVTIDVPAVTNAEFGLIPATGEEFFVAGPYDGFWDIIHCTNGYEAGVFLNNTGPVALSGTLTLTCDPMFTPMQDTYSSIAPDQSAAGFAQWNINAFEAGSNGLFSFHIAGPGPINIGTTYNFSFHMVLNDANGNVIYDNSWVTSPFIACSYDPNDLTATPQGYSDQHFVLAGDRMHYRVRFQNTGNLPAEDIRVVTALDPTQFDLSTFTPMYGSAPFVTCLLNNGTVDFTFNDIYLPDATNNEAASHGYVTYEVRLLPNVSPGDVLLQEAAIYFDSNPAVITNETFHTIFDCTSFTGINGDVELCAGEALTLTANQNYVETYTWTIDGQAAGSNASDLAFTPEAGTHTVQLITANPLCGETHTSNVIVHALPVISLPASASVCAGDAVTLAAASEGNITWSNGANNNSTITPESDMVITATATTDAGCVSSADWSISVLPLPSAAYTVDGVTLTATDGDAWQWYFNNTPIEGATSGTYIMQAAGTYSVMVTGMNGCSTMGGVTNYSVGVAEAADLGISVYPNPMDQSARIQLPSGVFNLEIRDMTGRVVWSHSGCQNTYTLERGSLAAGNYQLVIAGESIYATQRLMVK